MLCNHIQEKEKSQSQALDNNASSLIEAKEKEVVELNPKTFILKILLKNLPQSYSRGRLKNLENEFYDEYFSLLSVMIKLCQGSFDVSEGHESDLLLNDDRKFNSWKILKLSIETIQNIHNILSSSRKMTDARQSSAERLLCGYLLLCQSILETTPHLKVQAAQSFGLAETIKNFIFGSDSEPKKNQLNKQLSRNTRKRALSLLLTLCENNEANFGQALEILYLFHEKIEKSWRYIDFDEFATDVGLKQASGYVGLKNFGCTCYMNSLLQHLYLLPDLRDHILDVQFADGQDQDQLDDNLLYQLQILFANLQESEKQYFTPRGFVDTFKFYGEPVNVRI